MSKYTLLHTCTVTALCSKGDEGGDFFYTETQIVFFLVNPLSWSYSLQCFSEAMEDPVSMLRLLMALSRCSHSTAVYSSGETLALWCFSVASAHQPQLQNIKCHRQTSSCNMQQDPLPK